MQVQDNLKSKIFNVNSLPIDIKCNDSSFQAHYNIENINNYNCCNCKYSQYCECFEKKYNEQIYDEYSLKQHFFNPNKCSPPNEWNLRLNYRLNHKNNLY